MTQCEPVSSTYLLTSALVSIKGTAILAPVLDDGFGKGFSYNHQRAEICGRRLRRLAEMNKCTVGFQAAEQFCSAAGIFSRVELYQRAHAYEHFLAVHQIQEWC